MTNNPVADLLAVRQKIAQIISEDWADFVGVGPSELATADRILAALTPASAEPVAYQVAMSDGRWGTIFHHPDKPLGDHRPLYAQAEIARLTAERDAALAQAATAVMEMRERAAGIMDARSQYWDAIWTGRDSVLTKEDAKSIRALPIEADAQKALDQMLAKAREDALREAAAAYQNGIGAILALLSDGGRDE